MEQRHSRRSRVLIQAKLLKGYSSDALNVNLTPKDHLNRRSSVQVPASPPCQSADSGRVTPADLQFERQSRVSGLCLVMQVANDRSGQDADRHE